MASKYPLGKQLIRIKKASIKGWWYSSFANEEIVVTFHPYRHSNGANPNHILGEIDEEDLTERQLLLWQDHRSTMNYQGVLTGVWFVPEDIEFLSCDNLTLEEVLDKLQKEL